MPFNTIQSEAICTFATVWFKTRDRLRGRYPEKSDIPMRALARFMPYLVLHKQDTTGKRKWLLAGTGVTRLFGTDYTGCYFEDTFRLSDPSAHMKATMEYWAQHGKGAAFGRWGTGTAPTSAGNIVRYETLRLPYVEASDGSERNILLLDALDPLQYDETVIPHLTETEVRNFNPAGPRPDWLYLTKPVTA